jgi:hypothetical protein
MPSFNLRGRRSTLDRQLAFWENKLSGEKFVFSDSTRRQTLQSGGRHLESGKALDL